MQVQAPDPSGVDDVAPLLVVGVPTAVRETSVVPVRRPRPSA